MIDDNTNTTNNANTTTNNSNANNDNHDDTIIITTESPFTGVVQLIDYFEHYGPNGKHVCMARPDADAAERAYVCLSHRSRYAYHTDPVYIYVYAYFYAALHS